MAVLSNSERLLQAVLEVQRTRDALSDAPLHERRRHWDTMSWRDFYHIHIRPELHEELRAVVDTVDTPPPCVASRHRAESAETVVAGAFSSDSLW